MTPIEEQSVEGKVDQLIATANTVRRALNVRTTLISIVGAALLVLLLIVANQQSTLTDIAKINKVNAKTGADNSELIKNATGEEAQARSAAALVQIKKDVRVATGEEIDCRSRRQQARIPAPDNPDIPCKDQTDPSIYPGVEGLPARG